MSRGNSARGVVIGKVDFEEDSLKAVTEEKWDVEKEKRIITIRPGDQKLLPEKLYWKDIKNLETNNIMQNIIK